MRFYILLLFSFAQFFTQAQDTTIIDNDFVFNDGIYLSVEDLKNNTPILPGKIIGLVSDIILEDDKEFRRKRKTQTKNSQALGSSRAFTITWEELANDLPNYSIWIDRFLVTEKDTSKEYSNEIFAVVVNGDLYIKLHYKMAASGVGGIVISQKLKRYYSKVYSIGEVLIVMDEGKNAIKVASQRNLGNSGYTNSSYAMPNLIKSNSTMATYIVYLKDGSTIPLNPATVEELIYEDDDIYNQFIRNNKFTKEMVFYYAKKYCKKHPYLHIE